MIIIAIILGLLALGFGILWLSGAVKNDWNDRADWPGVLFFVFGALWFIAFLLSLVVSFNHKNLTGYIYSADNRFGYTTGHIRFSETAGEDVQPSFCVKSDSDAGRAIKELAGSGQKVRVDIPTYFYFTNNPFACGTTEMTIEKI